MIRQNFDMTFNFWIELSFSLDNMKKIFAAQSGKLPCEIIDDESIENFFKSSARNKDGLDILLFLFKNLTLSKKEKARFDTIYNRILREFKKE